MTDVLEHTINPAHKMPKIRQLLNPRGYLFVTFPTSCRPPRATCVRCRLSPAIAFQRTQDYEFELSLAGLLASPAHIAALPGIRRYFGNQMEFLSQLAD